MKRFINMAIVMLLAVGIFTLPIETFAETKAPGKVSAASVKVAVINGNSLKFSWGKAKTDNSVLTTTGYQIKYTVKYKDENGKWKTSVSNKLLKKGKALYHVYAGTKGNTYKVSLNVRAYNGKTYGGWTSTKTFTKTIPAFTGKYSKFNPGLGQVGANRSLTTDGYLNTQGCVFDTYSQTDGYSFAMASESGYSGVKVIHFKMDANDKITQIGSVRFKSPGDNPGKKTSGIGHANDGTMYMNNGKKYIFVAISGGVEETFTDSDGKSAQKIGYIDMDEYAKAEKSGAIGKIHRVIIKAPGKVKKSSSLAKCKFSGIAFTGMRTVGGKKRPVFVLKDGRTFYAAYATFASNGKPTLTLFDSARIVKPTFKINGKKKEAMTQDMAYHNEFLYINYSCKTSSNKTRFMIGRIKYTDLFKDNYGDLRNLQYCTKNIKTAQGKTLSKHIPEAIFFKSLKGKGNFYLSVNRGTTAAKASDIDAILKSKEKY